MLFNYVKNNTFARLTKVPTIAKILNILIFSNSSFKFEVDMRAFMNVED